jgi:hypothetical protein
MQRDAYFNSVYTTLRAKGQRHGQALRNIGDRLLRILVAMRRHRTCSDASRIRREPVVQMGYKIDKSGLTNGRKSVGTEIPQSSPAAIVAVDMGAEMPGGIDLTRPTMSRGHRVRLHRWRGHGM